MISGISDAAFQVRLACAGVYFEGKRVYSREIKVRLIRAGVCCEEMYVYSREIN